MNDLHTLLADADPLRVEPELTDAQAHVIRRAMLGAVEQQRTKALLWSDALPIAALVAVMMVTGTLVGRKLPPPDSTAPAAATLERGPDVERTQVQFATPGGTRIIWTLDPQFELGVVP